MNESVLLDFDAAVQFQNFGNMQGLIVIKDDHLVFENYYQQNSRRELFPVGRIGASLVSMLLGEVLNNELGNQIDTPIYQLLPEYSGIFDAEPLKRQITIRHLLTMQTGLVWNESLRTVADTGNDLSAMIISNDYVEFVLSKQVEATPGRRFSFNSGCYFILLKIMDQLLDTHLQAYFEERLFQTLGIEN